MSGLYRNNHGRKRQTNLSEEYIGMKYRIVQEREEMKSVRYIIERKGWFFWYPLVHIYNQNVIAFETEKQAEEYLYKVIKWDTPLVVKRRVVKEIRG